MASKNILEDFFDKKELAILKLFLFDQSSQFYLREVSKKTRVPIATTFRIIAKLKTLNIVQETLIKKTKLYSLSENKATKTLQGLFEEKKSILEDFIGTVSKLQGVDVIFSHGEDQKNKLEVIIIGENLDIKSINEKIGEIKYKHDFTILATPVNSQQFARLVLTGSVSDKRTILWERPTTELENQF